MAKASIEPDIFVDIDLYPTAKGGRGNNLQGEYFGCPIKIGTEMFDARIYLNGETISPGTSLGRVAIKFLSPELVKPLVKVGDRLFLWESKIFGEATVVELRF